MSLSSKINYAFEALSGITVGNINITGNIFQNNNPYIASQWTSTSGNALTYTSGNVIISNGSLVASNLTTGNINFTGTLSQNGSPYIGSQWTGTSGTLYYGTSGSSVVGINTTAPVYTLDVNGTLEASNANGLMLFASTGNLGIGTTAPSTKLDVVGTGRITTSLTTGALYSTNQTTTNIVGTTATITNLNIPGTLTVVNITSTNLVDSNITATNLRVTGTTSVANIYSSLGTISNLVNTNLSTSTLSISSTMTAPRIDIGGTQTVYNNNTLGKLFITGNQNSVTEGPNILITTTQDVFPTYNFLTYGHDSSWTMYDMYFDGSFRNSSTATAFMMVKESSTLKWNYNTSGFSAGATAPVSTSICIGSSGNVGLGGQVTPTYTLDVTGNARISSGLTAGASTFTSVSSGDSQFSNLSAGNINFTGNLFQNGSAYIGSQWVGTSGNIYFGTTGSSVIGINTTSPSTTLDVNGTGRISTSLTTGALYSTNQTTTNIVSTSQTNTNLVNTNISSATVNLSTGATTAAIRVTGLSTLATATATNVSVTTLNASTGATAAALRVTGLSTLSTVTATNVSSTTLNASTGITTGTITATGVSSLQNVTATNITVSNINVIGTSTSTNSSSGTVVLLGGLSIDEPTNATSVSNGGALTIAGGAAIAGDLIVGGSILYSNAAAASSTFAYLTLTASDWSTDVANGSLVVYGGISVQNTANATSASSGNGLTIAGGAGIGADLYVGGTSYLPNIVSTRNTTTNLVATGISASNINVSGTLTVVNITSTNLVETNITASNLTVTGTTSVANIYSSLGTVSNLVGTNLSSSNLISTVATIPNIIHTNVSAGTFVGTTVSTANTYHSLGTISNLVGTNLSSSNLIATVATIPNIVHTNISSGTYSGTTVSTSNIYTSLGTVSNLVGTNLSSTNLIATVATIPNIVSTTSLSTGTLVGTTSSTSNIYASLGTVNNLVGTNLSSTNLITTVATIPNITSTNITTSSILVTGASLNATFNTNTIGSIFTTGGNVAIGGTSPSATLDIATAGSGTKLRIAAPDGGDAIAFSTSTTGSGNVVFSMTNNRGAGQIIINQSSAVTGSIKLQTVSIDRVAIQSSRVSISTDLTVATNLIYTTGGNIGIGTTTPAYNLDVVGSGDFSTFVTTGALYSTNQTTTNLVATASTITNLSIPGTLTVVNITSTNLVETNITAGGIVVTGGSLNATFNSNTIGNIFTTGGSVGIGTTSPSASLHINTTNTFGHLYLGNVLQNRRIVLWNTNNNINQFMGFGVNPNTLRYQVETTSANHVFYAASSTTSSDELMRITGVGNVVISGSTSTTSVSSGSLYSTNQTTTNIVSTAISSGNVIANNNLNIAGISSFFGGSFSANNNVGSASTVTGLLFPSATVRSFIATLNINISKPSGNLNSTVTLEGTQLDSGWILYDSSLGDSTGLVFTINSSGQVLYTSPDYVGWVSTTIRFEAHYYTLAGTYTPVTLPTSGNVSVTGVLSVNNTSNATSTSSGALTVSGGAGISKSLLVGENLNVGGLSNTFTGSFAAANNVSSATNVTGLLVPTATFSSFTANVNVRILTTLTTLNAQYMFEATQSTGGWLLNDTSFGDSVGITFTITSAGQIQYTSTNVANWQSTTINFAVNAISISSGFTAVLPTSGSVAISGNLTIDNTTDSSSTSAASLVLAGGVGINKSLLVGGNFNIGGVTTQFAGTFGAANSASGASVTGLLFPTATIRSFTCTLSVRVVSSVNYNTQHTIEGIQTATGGWQINDYQIGDASGITFAINSSGQITYTSPTFTSWTSTTMHYNAVAYNISSSYTPIPMPTGGSSSVAGSLVIQSTDIASSTSSGALSVSGGVGIQNNLIVNDETLASGGILIPSTTTLEFGYGVAEKEQHAGKIGYNTFTNGLNIVGGGTTNTTRLVYLFDKLAMSNVTSNNRISLWGGGTTEHDFYGLGINSNTLRYQVSSNAAHRFYGAINATSSNELMSILGTGNVGIGTSSPNYTLDINGTLEVSNSNGLMLFASSGNVGIGTTSPSGRLHVFNNFTGSSLRLTGLANNTSSNTGIFFSNDDQITLSRFKTKILAVGNGFWGISDLHFCLNNQNTSSDAELSDTRMIITRSGNIGIGTTAPAYTLDVNGTLEASNTNGLILFASTGNVGIGTTSPGESLDVRGNLRVGGNTKGNYIAFYGTSGDTPGGWSHTFIGERIYAGTEQSELLLFKGNDASTGGGADRIRLLAAEHRFDTYTSNVSGTFEDVGATSVSNRMTITTAGNVGIGTATPSSTLDVNGSSRFGSLGSSYASIRSFTATLSTGAGNPSVITTTVNYGVTYTNAAKLIIQVTTSSIGVSDTFVTSIRTIGTSSMVLNVVRVDATTAYSNAPTAHITIFELV